MSTTEFEVSADPNLARRAAIQAAAASSLGRRKLYSTIGIGVCRGFLVIAVIPLLGVIIYVVEKGLPAWNADFFTQVTKPETIPNGGILNAIVGSLIIDGIAVAASVPFGIVAGLFLAESDGRVASTVRSMADILTGVPSITIGIFGYIVWVKSVGSYSGLAGAFAISIVMVPVIMRAAETALRSVPGSLNEAALSLGARKFTVARRVVIPAALPGLITGVLLAVARGAGETAPLLFTAFGNQFMQTDPTKPMETMPHTIYTYSQQPYADLVQIAWGTALLLMVVILVLNVGSRVVAARLGRERR